MTKRQMDLQVAFVVIVAIFAMIFAGYLLGLAVMGWSRDHDGKPN